LNTQSAPGVAALGWFFYRIARRQYCVAADELTCHRRVKCKQGGGTGGMLNG